jgi:hypothetical protein
MFVNGEQHRDTIRINFEVGINQTYRFQGGTALCELAAQLGNDPLTRISCADSRLPFVV